MRMAWSALGRVGDRFGPAIAVCAAAAWSATALRSPRARPESAEATAFSAARAMRHVRAVASDRRPTGSAAARRAAAYVFAELAELGFETEMQDEVAGHDLGPTPYGPRYLTAGHVRNVIGRIRGAAPGGAVLLMTHYDSVSQGPGANDAGVPVAALLEAFRAFLHATPQPMNDLLVVFTDGEEAGLLGARAFFDKHPLAATVGVALNFEARGVAGPVLMFEAGPGNGPMLNHLARTGVPVFASSLFDAIYRRMPNATDFGVSKQKGIPGLNFAHVGGFGSYHSPLDDVSSVDPDVLQHHGDLALGLARRLCSADLSQLRGQDSVYFPATRGQLVRLPARLAVPLTVLATMLWAGGLARMMLTEPASGKRLARAGALLAGRVVTGAVAGNAFTATAGAFAPEFRRHGDFHDSRDIFAGVVALATLSTLADPRGQDDPSMRVAAATAPLALVSVALARRLPGGSYLTLVPWIGAAASLYLLAPTGATNACATSGPSRSLGAALAAVPAAAILLPFSRLLFSGLTPRMAGSVVVTLQFIGEVSAPIVAQLPRSVRNSGVIGASMLAAGIVLRRRRRSEQGIRQPDTLSYLLDPERGEALWISSEKRPSARTSHVFGSNPARGRLPHYFPGWNRDFMQSPAPSIDLPPPEAILEESSVTTAGRRRVRLRVRSLRAARQISLAVLEARVYRWRIRDDSWVESPAIDSGDSWELWLHSVPAEGARVDIEMSSERARLRMLDRVDGLPEAFMKDPILGPAVQHRDSTYDAAALDVDTWGNASLVARTLNIPEHTESG